MSQCIYSEIEFQYIVQASTFPELAMGFAK